MDAEALEMALAANRKEKYSTEFIMKPTPEQIRAARLAAGLSQAEAGELILASKRSWENWEQGRVKMHPGLFDYFLIKTKQRS